MLKRALVEMSAVEVLAAFKALTLTPSDYLQACLEQIDKFNPSLNALIAIDREQAEIEAVAATQRWKEGAPKGLLDGLPIAVKDLQNTKGMLTTFGSPLYRNNIPDIDLPLVASLREAGAIVLAKTNVPEMGAGGNTKNSVWGATGNPFNPSLTAGGSSGGSAAALAANLLPLCTGSDTGGSLRLPASFCGVVGYRPSVEVIAHPTRPLAWSGISVLGPMARTMDDLVLMLDVCQQQDDDDPLSYPSVGAPFADLPAADLSKLRVAYSEDFGGTPVAPDIRETFHHRLAMLREHVAQCEAVDLDLGDMDRAFDVLRAESFLAAFEKPVADNPEQFCDSVKDNIALGKTMSLSDRAWAHKEQSSILRAYNLCMQDYDVLVLPTAPVSAFPWIEDYPEKIDGHKVDIYYRWLALTYRGSLLGVPAISLPSGTDSQALPFGFQIMGKVRGDRQLLAAARSVEALFEQDVTTARPRPDLVKLASSSVDLRNIVTCAPSSGSQVSAGNNVQTAV